MAAKAFPNLMPTDPVQLVLAVFEICLFAGGVGMAVWLLGGADARKRWLGTNSLAPADVPFSDLLICGVLIILVGFAFNAAAQLWLHRTIAAASDQQALALFAYSVANYAGALFAWKLIFPSLRKSWALRSATPWPPAGPTLPWPRAFRYAAGCLLVALPVLSLVSMGWNGVIEKLGLPAEPQDVVAIFTNTKSPLLVGGLLLVACVFAPIYEEQLFRAGLYRYCRQRLGRPAALLISGLGFGLLHLNWAGFVPLAILGMILAIAYEATGSIRVSIIAHGLFNLNTVLVLLSGLPEFAKQ